MEGVPNREALIAELEEIRIKAYERDMMDVNQKIFEKTTELQNRFPDFNDYKIYHVLNGSTVVREKFDFPEAEGEVEAFIRSL